MAIGDESLGSIFCSDYTRVTPGELFVGKRREEFSWKINIKELKWMMDLVRVIYRGETEYYGRAAGKNKSRFDSNPPIPS